MNEFPYTDEQLRQMFEAIYAADGPIEIEDFAYKYKIVRDLGLGDGIRSCMSIMAYENTPVFIKAYTEILSDDPAANFEIGEVIGIDVLAMAKLIESFGKKGGQNG